MTEEHAIGAAEAAHEDRHWPLRAWLLAGALGLLAWLANQFVSAVPPSPGRVAIASGLWSAGLAFALTLEQRRIAWNCAFAVAVGVVMGGIIWTQHHAIWSVISPWGWPVWAGALSLTLSVPLFQTWRDGVHHGRGAWPLDYPGLHRNAWTDAVIGAAGLAFTGLAWLTLWLLAGLFNLIGITAIERLMQNEGFGFAFSGAAFGAGVAILRDNERILATLQRVLLVVLSVLAPPLAAGLSIFLLSLLFTGLDTLWDATKSTTPIVMLCAIGAVLLVNAVIRDRLGEASGSRILKISAAVLAATVLPLTVIAAVSMGLRIAQHGLTPDRIWGLLAIAIGVAYGLAYLVALIRGRKAWPEFVRPGNLNLAVTVSAVLLLLALPIFDFGAWSARDQLARLESGKVKPEAFDYWAMKRNFGPEGARIHALLTRSPVPEIKKRALAANVEDNWKYRQKIEQQDRRAKLDQYIRVIPAGTALPAALREEIARIDRVCSGSACVVMPLGGTRWLLTGGNEFGDDLARCIVDLAPRTVVVGGKPVQSVVPDPCYEPMVAAPLPGGIKDATRVELRSVERKQVFVNGQPVGQPFE